MRIRDCLSGSILNLNSYILLGMSGRRDSNPRPTAWKAVTLPTELLPRSIPPDDTLPSLVGREGFEPPKDEADRFTVCCVLPLRYLPATFGHPYPGRHPSISPHVSSNPTNAAELAVGFEPT